VVIEDSATGVAAARAAGMRVLGYAAMGQARRLLDAGADGVFDRLGELPALLVPAKR
jgi:beta-phosphoglucomutase-like phosphatase (HAD superfamily)